MKISIEINDQTYRIDAGRPLHISIPLRFNGAQPNAYGVEKAASRPCAAGALVGDTRRGGSCNFEQYTFIPHCNGTHTEAVGHLTHERIAVHDMLRDVFIPATIVSVTPETAGQTNDGYPVELQDSDNLITRNALETALAGADENFLAALVVRTLPNDESKTTREYLETAPPFFSRDAMLFLRAIGVRHLICDLPSIDRIFDEGRLVNHRIFWNIEQGSFETDKDSLVSHTITELAFVPDEIKDGRYVLNLQIAAFASDASPSRPVLFAIL